MNETVNKVKTETH